MSERDDMYGAILASVVEAAKARGREAASKEGRFEDGLATAYYEMISIALEQCEALGVDPKEIGLADIDPEQELLKAG